MANTPKDPASYMTPKGYLRLSPLEKVNHYFIVLVLFVLAVFPAYDVFLYMLNGEEPRDTVFTESVALSIFWLLAAVVFYFIQRRQLTFRKANTSVTDEQLTAAFKRTAKLHNWKNQEIRHDFYRAFHEDWFSPMKGEMITVIRVGDDVWVNSVCDLKSWTTVSSLGWNMHNVKLFFHHLQAVIANRPVGSDEKPALRKKLSRKLAKRIITYPVGICMLAAGIYYALHGIGPFKNAISVALIVLPLIYVVVDLKSIAKKDKPASS